MSKCQIKNAKISSPDAHIFFSAAPHMFLFGNDFYHHQTNFFVIHCFADAFNLQNKIHGGRNQK